MTGKTFIDTNLLVYFYSEDEPEKSSIIETILKSNKIILSSQIINEFSYVMLRKFKTEPSLIREIIEEWKKQFDLKPLKPEYSLDALRIHEKYRFSFWDSLVIVTAIKNKCKILYTEDLQHNQLIEEKLRVINPFV